MSLLLITLSAGGPVNYVLTCDAGSYTYTGQAATLSLERKLACDTGAYAYTGQDATLQVRHSLVCDAGAYVYTGNDATLQVRHSIVCDVGAYSYTGNDATLTYVPGVVNYTLACDSGSYAYTGNVATLVHVGVEQNSGGWPDYSYLSFPSEKEEKKYIERQISLEQDINKAKVEIDFNAKNDLEHKKIDSLERKLDALLQELDSIKILNALIREQKQKTDELLEEEMLMLLLAA